MDVFFLPDGTTRRPLVDRADGIWLWDTDGRRYLDASSGPITCNLGHGNRRVIEAMRHQASRVAYATHSQFENQPNNDLADLVTGLAGPGLERAFMVSGGSEANEAAIKLARQYAVARGQTGRWQVLSRQPSYHGSTLGAASVTGDPHSQAVFEPIMRVMPRVPAPFTYRLPPSFDAAGYGRHCAQALETAILAEGPESVLAFILEPVGGLATGALVATEDYLTRVRQICDDYGVLLIFDEVMSGAGRTGRFLAAHHWPAARPDIVTLAKGIAAGYTPFGMMLAPAAMVETVVGAGGFLHGHTYGANPLSCAIALAVQQEMLDQDLIANAARLGPVLRAGLLQIMADSRIVGDVRGLGLLQAIEIVADRDRKAVFPAASQAIGRLIAIGMDLGIALYSRRTADGANGEWLMIAPPLIITDDEVAILLDLLARTVRRFEAEVLA